LFAVYFLIGVITSSGASQSSVKSYNTILKKNVFTNLVETAKPVVVLNPVSSLPEPELPDKTFNLLGTVVDTRTAANSLAVFVNVRTKQDFFLSPGAALGNTKIVHIEKEGVVLENSFGDRFFFTCFGLRPLGLFPKTFFYRVNLGQLLQKLQQETDLLSSLKLTPAEIKGTGVKLTGIVAETVMEKLGLANDDIIHSLNGVTLTSTVDLLQAYQKLLSEGQKQVVVRVMREKRPLRLVYQLE